MLRRLSLPEHGALELVVGLALIAAPLVLGFGPGALLASVAAGAVIAGLGLSENMAISAHMSADLAVGLALIAAGAALGAGGDRLAGAVLAAAAAAELTLTACTRWTRRV